MKKRNIKAFTVVELVIVIAVIAILAAVMIPTFSGLIRKANKSADEAEITSLNTQLAIWDGDITTEADLYAVIAETYGEETAKTFAPRSAKHGLHYWYDVAKNRVILSKYEDLDATPVNTVNANSGVTMLSNVTPLAAGEEKAPFAPNSLRTITKGERQYFFIDKSGSAVAEFFDLIDTISENNYSDIEAALESLKGEIVNAIKTRLASVAILNGNGLFTKVEKPSAIYIPVNKDTENVIALGTAIYKDGDLVDRNAVDFSEIKRIDLPNGYKVLTAGLTGFRGADATPMLENTTELHVNAKESDLGTIFEAYSTDCVIVLPNGSRYIIEGTSIYKLPKGDTPITDDLKADSVPDVKIEYTDGNENVGADTGYFYNGTLYIAYDIENGAQLSLADGVASSMVNWTVSDNAPISIDETGKITVVGAPDPLNVTATVTATSKYNNEKTDSINVVLVFPTTVDWSLETIGDKTADSNVINEPIKLSISDVDKLSFEIKATGTVGYTYNSYVKMAGAESVQFILGDGNLLTKDGEKLVAHPGNITEENNTQTLNVIYKVGEQTYITATYDIIVSDDTNCPISVNAITNSLNMGDKYLFRVGNSNAFNLNKLFNGTTDKKVKIEIYDVALTDNDGEENLIATSGNFYAKINDIAANTKECSDGNWNEIKVQFFGTGVAIIRFTANGKTEELHIEVVDGYNITSAGELKTNKNNILLNDIDISDYSNNYISFSGNTTNHVVLYGNGFKFNIEAGRNNNFGVITLTNADIDNTRIIGSIYTEYGDSWDNGNTPYYASAVYVTANSRISNSYIFGCRANVRVDNLISKGTLELVDTVLDCGRFANLDVAGNAVLEGVTTVNEPRPDNKNVAGFSVVIPQEGGSSTIEIKGKGLTQYNWMTSSDSSKLPNFTGKNVLFNAMFDTEYAAFQHKHGTETYVNMGIISMSSETDGSNIKYESQYYTEKTATLTGFSGYVVSLGEKYSLSSNDLTYREDTYSWDPSKQSASLPTFTWTAGYEDYKHEISFDSGSSVTFDPKVLIAEKHKQGLEVTIKLENDSSYTGGGKTFTEGGTYTFEYTVTDPYVYNLDGTLAEAKIYTYKLTVEVEVRETTIKEPEFTFNGVKATIVEGTDGKFYVTLPAGTANTKTTTAGGKTITYPIAEGKTQAVSLGNNKYWYFPYYSIVTITNYTDAFGNNTIFNSSTTSKGPVPESYSGDLYWGKSDAEGNYSDYGGYGMKRNTSNDSKYQVERETTVQFSFTAGNNTTYYYYIHYAFDTTDDAPSSGGGSDNCIAAGTMITLADGSKKAVEDLRKGDMVMSFDHLTGEITYKDVIIVARTYSESYYKNTFVFDDGTELVTINEHGIYDLDLNKYVNIDHINYTDYLGHSFVSVDAEGNLGVKKLVDVKTVCGGGYKYDIVTNGTLNYVAEDTLSVTHVLVDVINSFDFGSDLKYDAEKMLSDIEKYGLYDYAEWEEYCDISVFDQYNIPVMKVGISKGLYTKEYIIGLINTYVLNDSAQIID